MDPLPFLTPFLSGLLLTTGVGLLIGLEREFNTREEKGHLAGLRTFPLLALVGYLSAWMGQQGLSWILPVSLSGVFMLVAVA